MYFYVWRVNYSLAKLGLPPNIIRQDWKAGLMAVGKQSGNSPQEVALWLAAQLPANYRAACNPIPAKVWIRQRKVNPRSPEMREALESMGWGELAEY